ncbi:putative MFS family arabinose efflux permease [Haloactinospora alba]|uniref:Putative MFS family arabinose efflux permease n=1 Tax=Haloactinospora alba TaxID=405555 RepID=A0A543NLM4_9ACTN|nr:MFS transporter [Haloactinospora alba]TQN32720.1 putative MFS family arabinose efflux permease [Haloactinospora alba]
MSRTWDLSAGTGGQPAHPGLRGWGFALLLLATVASFCGYVLLLPLVPLWAARGGASEFGAGSTTSAFMLATVLTQLAMPWLLARGGYRWTLPAGAVLLGAPAPLLLLTTDLAPLLVLSALRGVGFGMVTVAGAAMAVRLVPSSQMGRASGYYGMAVGLPNLVLLSAGVWLALHAGFSAVFWTAGLAPVLGAVAAAAIGRVSGGTVAPAEPESTAETPDPEASRSRGRMYAALAVPLVVMLLPAIASSGIVTFLPIPLENASGAVTAALLVFGAAMVASRWLGGLLSDRRGRPCLLLPAAASAVAGMGLVAAGLWPAQEGWAGPGGAGTALVVAGAALFGAGFGGVQNDTIVLMFRRCGPRAYGTASAAWNIGYDAGTGAGSLGLGLAIQHVGYGPGFAAASVAMLACLPLSLAMAGRSGPSRDRGSPQ